MKCKLDKDSEEYKKWYEAHKPKCQANFQGSSPAMEAACPKDIWTRSIDYGLQYKYMVCDGDSKSYNVV